MNVQIKVYKQRLSNCNLTENVSPAKNMFREFIFIQGSMYRHK